jgi:hypothetical protein
MLQTELLIGAAGWDNEKWVGGFYPSDLPEDWRFGYYTNRLRSVLVPASFWHAADVDTRIENMLEDLYPEFRMVLEWELSDSDNVLSEAQDFLQKTRPVDENVDAYLVSVAGTANATALQAIKLLQQQHPVCIAGRDTQTEKEFAGLDEVSQCWETRAQAQPLARGRFLVALTDNTDPRGIREIIEKIDAWPEGLPPVQGAALFFNNEKAADTAFQARTIAELMGV